MSLRARIEENFRANADRVFLIEPGVETLTYRRFYDLACHAAGMFEQMGLKPGARAGIVMNNSREFAAIYFGALFSGITLVPVNQALSKNEIGFLLQNSGLDLLIFSMCTRPLLIEAAEGLRCKKVCVMQGMERTFHPEVTEIHSLEEFPDRRASGWKPDFADDHTLPIVFTSGTTSLPKGIRQRIVSYFQAAEAFNKAMGFGPENRFLDNWSMAYNTGFLNTMLCAFMAGGSVVITRVYDAKSPLDFWRPVIENQVNTLWFSPSMMAALNRVDRDPAGPKYCRSSIKAVCAGTAPLPLKVKQEFEAKYGVEVFESYGVSEVLFVSLNSPKHPRRERAVGRVLPGIELELRDDNGSVVPAGAEGEIVVRSPWMMQGYVDFENSNPKQHHPMDTFATGDLGRFDDEGNLYITGRKKDLIIRGGLNISPRVIEEAILEVPSIEQVAVIGLPHEHYGEEIIATVVLKPGRDIEAERFSILKHCRERLSAHAVPSKVLGFDKFPSGSTGKILKREIREQVLRQLASPTTS